ncbi:MAG: hypothetical protein HW375_17 [Anaerolineales bacterium]|nr:hypothetical protein [Anaerolineales bacterium]
MTRKYLIQLAAFGAWIVIGAILTRWQSDWSAPVWFGVGVAILGLLAWVSTSWQRSLDQQMVENRLASLRRPQQPRTYRGSALRTMYARGELPRPRSAVSSGMPDPLASPWPDARADGTRRGGLTAGGQRRQTDRR